jgi:LCP family protein required for cell wall assembly
VSENQSAQFEGSEPEIENNENGQKTKKRGRLSSPSLLILIGITILLLGFLTGRLLLNTRMFGEPLQLSADDQPIPTITLPIPQQTSTGQPTRTPTSTPDPAFSPTPTLVPMCGARQPVSYFLFIAKDYEMENNENQRPEDYDVGFADALRLIRIDYRDATVEVLPIPRDLIVAVPLHEYGIYEERLKIVYAHGNEYDVPGGGASLIAQTLASNFGIQTDHYVTLNFWAFVVSIDLIGGIDIHIPVTVGPYTAGEHHFNGWQALDYARLRDQAGEDTSDASRRARQTQVLYAIQDKLFSAEMLPKVFSLIPKMLSYVRTDLTNQEIEDLVCIAEKIQNVEYLSFPADLYTQEEDAVGNELLVPNYYTVREYVSEFQRP